MCRMPSMNVKKSKRDKHTSIVEKKDLDLGLVFRYCRALSFILLLLLLLLLLLRYFTSTHNRRSVNHHYKTSTQKPLHFEFSFKWMGFFSFLLFSFGVVLSVSGHCSANQTCEFIKFSAILHSSHN